MRASAFVDRAVETLSDSSYTFGYALLSKLLEDLNSSDRRMSSSGSFKELLHVITMRLLGPVRSCGRPFECVGRSEEAAAYLRYELVPFEPTANADEEHEGWEHVKHLDRASVTLLRFDGEPTFHGAPAVGREAAEQAAAEAALAFIVRQTARLEA